MTFPTSIGMSLSSRASSTLATSGAAGRIRGALACSTGLGSTRSSKQPATLVAVTLIGPCWPASARQGVAEVVVVGRVLALSLADTGRRSHPGSGSERSRPAPPPRRSARPAPSRRPCSRGLSGPGKSMPVSLHEPGDVLLGLVSVGIDAEQHDALLAVLSIELDQPRNVQVCPPGNRFPGTRARSPSGPENRRGSWSDPRSRP